ncbi:MAG: hypothetical protein ACSHWY_06500 [Octadecabacter sp.]
MFDYNRIVSLSDEEFEKRVVRPSDNPHLILVNEDEKRKIEMILDVMPNVLDTVPMYFEKSICKCGCTVTMYDFVVTAIVDGGHPKSFILHTLLGSKKILNDSREVRCITCGEKCGSSSSYHMESYACKWPAD